MIKNIYCFIGTLFPFKPPPSPENAEAIYFQRKIITMVCSILLSQSNNIWSTIQVPKQVALQEQNIERVTFLGHSNTKELVFTISKNSVKMCFHTFHCIHKARRKDQYKELWTWSQRLCNQILALSF